MIRWPRRLLTAALLVIVVLLAWSLVSVYLTTDRDDASAGPYDAIVVLGAAQYDGRPSPVLQRRLDHAHELLTAGRGSRVILTGSKQPGDRYTEAFTGYRYLRDQGVPEGALLVVTDGGDTFESLAAARTAMQTKGLRRVLLVSDPYHSARLLGIAEELGIDAGVSPTDTSASQASIMREGIAVALGRVVSYRRLGRLD